MTDSALPAWRLVQQCAQELTEQGAAPFTRQDLIRCVRHKNPRYGPNSINPVIQGLTDNLRGGAPRAAGRNVLHRVSRGRFELAEDGPAAGPASADNPRPPGPNGPAPSQQASVDGGRSLENEAPSTFIIGGYEFLYICALEPERRRDGSLAVFFPHERYANNRGLAVHRTGLARSALL